MADNFTGDQVQGVFGEFVPVLDDAIAGGNFSANHTQGVFGEFVPVLDEAAGGGGFQPAWAVRSTQVIQQGISYA
jgi:hypothetical protein